MTDKELRRLSRGELLEMLIAQTEENQNLQSRLEAAEAQLAERRIAIEKAGTLAEASLALNGVFEAAEAAAQQYLENIQQLSERQDTINRKLQEETEQACASQRAEAEALAAQLRQEAQTQADTIRQEAKAQADAVRQEAEAQAAEIRGEAETYAAGTRQEAEAYSQKIRSEADLYWNLVLDKAEKQLQDHDTLRETIQSADRIESK